MANITFNHLSGYWFFKLDDGRSGTGNTFESCVKRIASMNP